MRKTRTILTISCNNHYNSSHCHTYSLTSRALAGIWLHSQYQSGSDCKFGGMIQLAIPTARSLCSHYTVLYCAVLSTLYSVLPDGRRPSYRLSATHTTHMCNKQLVSLTPITPLTTTPLLLYSTLLYLLTTNYWWIRNKQARISNRYM